MVVETLPISIWSRREGATQGKPLMSLHIDSEEVDRLAEELSRLTGESPAAAVATALRERLDRVQAGERRPDDRGLSERLLAIGRETAPLWKEPYRSMDHGDLLYDDDGLPK